MLGLPYDTFPTGLQVLGAYPFTSIHVCQCSFLQQRGKSIQTNSLNSDTQSDI